MGYTKMANNHMVLGFTAIALFIVVSVYVIFPQGYQSLVYLKTTTEPKLPQSIELADKTQVCNNSAETRIANFRAPCREYGDLEAEKLETYLLSKPKIRKFRFYDTVNVTANIYIHHVLLSRTGNIVIEERTKEGRFSQGGSSFLVILNGGLHQIISSQNVSDINEYLPSSNNTDNVTNRSMMATVANKGTTIQVCGVEDFRNGTYHVCCHISSGCYRLQIILQFVKYDAFVSFNRPPLKRYLYSNIVCFKNEIQRIMYIGYTGKWIHFQNSWVLMMNNDFIYPREENIIRDRVCSCLSSYKSIIMQGVSHLRYTTFYMLNQCTGYMPSKNETKRHVSWNRENVYFRWVRSMEGYADDFNTTVGKILQSLNRGEKVVMVIQTGTWDLAERGQMYTYTQSLPSFIQYIKQIKVAVTKYGSQFRPIIMTTPAFPDYVIYSRKGGRNNYAISAISKKIHDAATEAGIEVVDMFTLTHPHQRSPKVEGLPGASHWLGFTKDGMKGYFGKIVAQVMFDKICWNASQ